MNKYIYTILLTLFTTSTYSMKVSYTPKKRQQLLDINPNPYKKQKIKYLPSSELGIPLSPLFEIDALLTIQIPETRPANTATTTIINPVLINTQANNALSTCYWNNCGQQFTSLEKFYAHVNQHYQKSEKNPNNEYPCLWNQTDLQKCDFAFKKHCHFLDHMRRHTGERPFKCTVDGCNKAFTSATNLRRHKQAKHPNEPIFKCTVDGCNETFKTNKSFIQHKKTKHPKYYTCSFCNYMTTRLQNFQTHMRTHTDEKPYKCNDCNKTFKAQANLIRHKKIHTREKDYICPVCNDKFTQKSNLERHINRKHKNTDT